jgi:hypothetical protein
VPAPVTDLAVARRRRNQRLGWSAGLVAAAAAVVAGALLAPNLLPHSSPGQAAPVQTTALTPDSAVQAERPLLLSGGQLGTALSQVSGSDDYGPLADPSTRDACLRANGLPAGGTPIAGRQVVLDGRPGVVLVLTTGVIGRFRLLAVGPSCSAGDPAKLAEATIGGIPASR